MKRANKNHRHADSRRRRFSLLLAVLWLVSFLQPCLMAASGNVYASFTENQKVHQQELAGDDQHREVAGHGNLQECGSCQTGHSESGDCSSGVPSCCSDLPTYISSLSDQVDAKDLNHKLTGPGFPALFSLENQTGPAKLFSRTPPEFFPPGPSVQSKYRVYLK